MTNNQSLATSKTPFDMAENPEWVLKNLGIDMSKEYLTGIITISRDRETQLWRAGYKCDDPFFIMEARSRGEKNYGHRLPATAVMVARQDYWFHELLKKLGITPVMLYRNTNDGDST